MKRSTLFYIILAISFIISVFVVPSPELNYKEMIAIERMEKGKKYHAGDVSFKKVLGYKARVWEQIALTTLLTAVFYPLASFILGNDKESEESSIALSRKPDRKAKVTEGSNTELSGEIVAFFKTELEARFKEFTIYKMFFEIGEYWNERDEECVDFHLVIATDDESDEVGHYIIGDADSDKNCIRYLGFAPLETKNLEYSDAVKIAKNVVEQIKCNFDFNGYNLSDDFKIFNLEEY